MSKIYSYAVNAYNNVSGTIHFSGTSSTNETFTFELTGYNPSLVPCKLKYNSNSEDGYHAKAGMSEREICKQILLNCHVNSPFSSSTASIVEFNLSKSNSSESWEMIMKDLNGKIYTVEIKNRKENLNTFINTWGNVKIDESKWRNSKLFNEDIIKLYCIVTGDGYMILQQLNNMTDESIDLKSRLEWESGERKNKVWKKTGYIPLQGCSVRKYENRYF